MTTAPSSAGRATTPSPIFRTRESSASRSSSPLARITSTARTATASYATIWPPSARRGPTTAGPRTRARNGRRAATGSSSRRSPLAPPVRRPRRLLRQRPPPDPHPVRRWRCSEFARRRRTKGQSSGGPTTPFTRPSSRYGRSRNPSRRGYSARSSCGRTRSRASPSCSAPSARPIQSSSATLTPHGHSRCAAGFCATRWCVVEVESNASSLLLSNVRPVSCC